MVERQYSPAGFLDTQPEASVISRTHCIAIPCHSVRLSTGESINGG